jgi:hypothetical protein
MTFIIDGENNITAFASQAEADGKGESFSSHAELAELAGKWPGSRLIEVWNSIPGLTPVKKFTDRKSAVSRIWKAIQSLGGGSATKSGHGSPKAGQQGESAEQAAQEYEDRCEGQGREGETRHR